MNLFISIAADVLPAPKNVPELFARYAQGYKYLILDPQAYVSWTASGQRFTTPLTDYLGFINAQMPVVGKFTHLNPALMERFVFDHNEHLLNSIQFLNRKKEDSGAVYVYDLSQSLAVMQKIIESTSAKAGLP